MEWAQTEAMGIARSAAGQVEGLKAGMLQNNQGISPAVLGLHVDNVGLKSRMERLEASLARPPASVPPQCPSTVTSVAADHRVQPMPASLGVGLAPHLAGPPVRAMGQSSASPSAAFEQAVGARQGFFHATESVSAPGLLPGYFKDERSSPPEISRTSAGIFTKIVPPDEEDGRATGYPPHIRWVDLHWGPMSGPRRCARRMWRGEVAQRNHRSLHGGKQTLSRPQSSGCARHRGFPVKPRIGRDFAQTGRDF